MIVEAEPLETLRRRTSVKWTEYPPDVLPLFVAEMDYPLAPGLSRVLHERIAASDSGYVGSPGELSGVFADFAERRWGWRPGLGGIRTTTDVSVAIVETLRQAIRPGDGVVITTPVYPPFVSFIGEAGGVVVDVPLLDAADRPSGYALDLNGIDSAFAAGARAASEIVRNGVKVCPACTSGAWISSLMTMTSCRAALAASVSRSSAGWMRPSGLCGWQSSMARAPAANARSMPVRSSA